jgi:pseudouridine synthase
MNGKENGSAHGDTPRDDSLVEDQSAGRNSSLKNDGEIAAKAKGAPQQSTPDGEGERLQKLIARAGIASRRAAEELITEGRVFVNGRAVKELGAKANPQTDRIVVDGKPIVFSDKASTVVLLHKPRGYVTTKSDPEKRAVVFDLLPKKLQHLHPVGRLDYDTAGVLILTDDGDLTHLLTHPSHGIEKVYHARARGEIKTEELKKLESGVWITEGEGSAQRKVKTLRCRAKLRAQTESNALVEIALREGRNRQVRRMLEAIGHPVSALRRISFAGVELEGLPSGAHRVLLDGEVHELRKRAARQLDKAKRQKDRPQPQDDFRDEETTRHKPVRFARKDDAAERRTSVKSSGSSKAAPKNASGKTRSTPRTSGSKPGNSKPDRKSTSLGERIRREWK